MEASPISYRTRLYRKAVAAVICGLILAASAPLFAQYAKKRQVSKGPRAVALLQLAENGKAHLVPITIMIDGKFYDAGAYKADPVPMALQSETVYEALKSGVSQGLFTVSGAMPQNGGWIADGKWRSDAELKAAADHNKAEAAKKAYKAPDDISGPPKLKRAPQSGDQTPPSSPSASPPSTPPSSTGGANSPGTQSSAPSKGNVPPSSSDASKTGAGNPIPSAKSSDSQDSIDAPDRPILRRQPVSDTPDEQTKAGNEGEPLKGPIQLIPAVSDSDGAEPRPYTYEMKPEEKQKFLKTMTSMAMDEVRARAKQLLAESEPPVKSARKTARPAIEITPDMQDVRMDVFDLTSSNEPVLVLTATATIPNARIPLQYSTALVAREDIYGELHKVFAQTTDNQHLDVIPKFEFIDAVDVDGDGRGELLFRTTQDSGTAFNIYAVIGDRLWPMFEGKPGS